MSQHAEEAAARGHGPRPDVCNHDGPLVKVQPPPPAGVLLWCNRCGAFNAYGDWLKPTLLVEVVRDRDTMCETLTIAQEVGTKLVEENRLLRAHAARFGV